MVEADSDYGANLSTLCENHGAPLVYEAYAPQDRARRCSYEVFDASWAP